MARLRLTPGNRRKSGPGTYDTVKSRKLNRLSLRYSLP